MATFSTSGKYTTDRVQREFLEEQAKSQFIRDHEFTVFGQYGSLEDYLAAKDPKTGKYENRIEYEKETKKYIDSMTGIMKFLDDSKTIMSGLGVETKEKRQKLLPAQAKVYQDFAPVARYILDVFHSKPASTVQTPKQLMNVSIENDKKLNYAISYSKTRAWHVGQSMAAAKEGFENLIEKGNFLDYDLEALGKQVTEYAFVLANTDGTVNPSDITNGIIGISDRNADDIERIINNYALYGIGGKRGINEKTELYIVQNAAKFAHENTKITLKDGRYVLESFASEEDVLHPDVDMAKKGFGMLRTIWSHNQNLVDFSYNGNTYHVTRYESDILKNLLAAKENDLTLATQNGVIFDNHLLEQMFADGTADAKKLFYDQFGGDLNKSLKNLDVVAMLREFDNPDWHRSPQGIAAAKAHPNEYWNSSAVVTARYATDAEETTKKILGDYYVEHAAVPDAVKQALTLVGITKDNSFVKEVEKDGKMIPNTEYVFSNLYANSRARTRDMKRGDIFFVDNSFVSEEGNGALSFVFDPLNGNIRFSGGAKVGPNGKAEEDIIQKNFKKGTLVYYDGSMEIEPTDELRKQLGLVGNDISSKLIVSRYIPYSRDTSVSAKNPIYRVSTPSNAETFVSQNLDFVGHVDPQTIKEGIDKLKTDAEKTAYKKRFEKFSALSPEQQIGQLVRGEFHEFIDTTEATRDTKYHVGYDIEKTIERSDLIRQADSTANWFRSRFGYDVAQKAEKLISELHTEIEKNPNLSNIKTLSEPVRLREAYKYIVKALHGDKESQAYARSFLERTIGSIFGQKTFLDYGTVDNFGNAVPYLSGTMDVIDFALKKTDQIVSQMSIGNMPYSVKKSVKNKYFTAIFQNSMAFLGSEAGLSAKESIGNYIQVPLTAGDESTFAIDLAPIMPQRKISSANLFSSQQRILRVPLSEDGAVNIASKAARMLDMEPLQAIRAVSNLVGQQYGEAKHLSSEKHHANVAPTVESETADLIKALRFVRTNMSEGANNKVGGVPSPVSIMSMSTTPKSIDAAKKKYGSKDALFKALDVANKDFTPETYAPITEKKIFDAVNQVTENLFSETNRFLSGYSKRTPEEQEAHHRVIQELHDKYGYSEREAEEMVDDLFYRKQTVKGAISNIFTSVFSQGNPSLGFRYDDDGRLIFFDADSPAEFDITKNLPVSKFDNRHGVFWMQQGNMHIATRKNVYFDKNLEQFHIGSVYEDWAQSLKRSLHGFTSKRIQRTAEEKLGYLQNYFSYALKTISPYQTPANDLQDARKTFSVGFKEFILGLADFDLNSLYGDTISDETKKVLAALSKKDFEQRNISNDQTKVLANDLYALISPFASGNNTALDLIDPSQRQYFSKIFSAIDPSVIKHASQLTLYTSNLGIDPFMEIGPAARGVANVMARANTIDVDEYENLDADGKMRIRLGQTIESRRNTLRKINGLDNSERALRGKIIDIGTNDFLNILKQRDAYSLVENYIGTIVDADPDKIDEKAEEVISMLQTTLNESGSIMDPRVTRLLNRNIIQKGRLDNVISINRLAAVLSSNQSQKLEREERLRRSTNELIKIINGRVSFGYSDAHEYINAGETFLWEESYKGTASKVQADRSGFLERRYYRDTTNTVVSANEIQDILQKHINDFGGLESDDDAITALKIREKASNILRKEGITEKYLIDPSEILGYRKVLLDTEKSTAYFPITYFGQFSSSLHNIIEGLYLSNGKTALRPTDASLRTEQTFADYLNANNANKHITAEHVRKVIQENGYESMAEVRNAYHMEQAVPYDLMLGILRDKLGIDVENAIGVTKNYSKEATKGSHRELGRMQSLFEEAFQKSGLSRDEFLEKVSPYITAPDGKTAISAGSRVDNFSIAENYIIDTEGLFGKSGILTPYLGGIHKTENGTYTIRYANIMNPHDADEAAFNAENPEKGIKATRRMFENMSQERWGISVLKEIAKTYGTEDAEGNISYTQESVDKFNKLYEGIASLDKNGAVSMHGSGGINDAIIRSMQEEIVAGNTGDIVALNGEFNQRKVQEIVDNGVPKKAVDSIIDSFMKRGYSTIGAETIYNTYAYEQGRMAINANNALKTMQDEAEQTKYIEELSKKSNLDILKIDDVKSVDRFIRNDPSRTADRSFIIDLGDIRARGTYGPNNEDFSSRYVVVPFTKSSVMDSNADGGVYSKANFVRSIETLARTAVDRNSTLDGDKLASTLMSDIVKATNSKTGAIADATSGYMPGSAMFKADIISDRADTLATRRARIDGMSVAERSELGLRSNAIFVGEDFFKNAISSDLKRILDKSTADIESVRRVAKTEGFAGIGLRQPMEYMNSVASSRIFLDESLSQNQVRFSWSMANAMNADKDGDLVYTMLLRSRANVYKITEDEDGEEVKEMIAQGVRLNQLDKAYTERSLGKKSRYEVEFENPDFFKKVDRARDYLERHAYSGIGEMDSNDMEEKLASDTFIQDYSFGGKIYSGQAIAGTETIRQANETRYKTIVNSSEFQDHLNSWINENNKQDAGIESSALTYNELADLTGRVGVANSYIEKVRNNEIAAPEGMSLDDIAQAFAYQSQKTAVAHNLESSLSKADAGIANYHIYRLQVMKNMARKLGENEMTNADDEIFGAVMTHMKDAFQAPKNNSDAGLFSMGNLRYAIEGFVGANKGGYVDKKPLYNIIEAMYNSEDGIKELKSIPRMDDIQTVDGQIPLQRVFEAFDKILPQGKRVSRSYWDSLSLGYGIAASETNAAELDQNSILAHIEGAATELAESVGDAGVGTENISLFENAKLLSNADRATQDAFDAAHESHFGFSHTFDGVPEAEDPGFVRKLAGSLHDIKSSMGSKGAIAMLGFAGMTMMAGVFGGAPTSPTPAQGQAQGIQSENAMYEIPSTISADTVPSVNNKQSYIININASTDKGRDFATTAINQAMSSVPNNTGNVSMTMNVKDSSSNMSYSDIASYVQNML